MIKTSNQNSSNQVENFELEPMDLLQASDSDFNVYRELEDFPNQGSSHGVELQKNLKLLSESCNRFSFLMREISYLIL